MGKSAGKWIKTVLFGKKHTKSKHATSDKNTPVKNPLEDPAANAPLTSEPIQLSERGTDSLELEKDSSLSPCDENQGVDLPSYVASVQVSDADIIRQEQAATTAQAAFRGYLARRAFRALKGIIRLQALIRGHLVRRQAVATLRCMRAIVQLQALARGRKVRVSEARLIVLEKFKLQDANSVDNEVDSLLRFEKLATNAFVCKLIISVPNAMPLALQYDLSEPNSASNWLERWSLSRFWASQVRTKRNPKPKPQRKQSVSQIGEVEPVKLARTMRKAVTNGDHGHGASATFEVDKLKRNPRKVTSANQTESTPQDQSQTELERVKRNLRKVSSASASDKPETLPPKKPIQSVETVATQLETVTSLENPSKSDAVVDNSVSLETEPVITSCETPVETHSMVENVVKAEETASALEDEGTNVDSSSGKENSKTRKRNSLPAKHEYAENILQNSPALPSYMAATKSAKAKLRTHGSSKLVEDGVEQGYVRRHSLPALSSGKLSSLSPRIQKPTQAATNGRRGNRTNPSLTASRDDKVLQPGWRR